MNTYSWRSIFISQFSASAVIRSPALTSPFNSFAARRRVNVRLALLPYALHIDPRPAPGVLRLGFGLWRIACDKNGHPGDNAIKALHAVSARFNVAFRRCGLLYL